MRSYSIIQDGIEMSVFRWLLVHTYVYINFVMGIYVYQLCSTHSASAAYSFPQHSGVPRWEGNGVAPPKSVIQKFLECF